MTWKTDQEFYADFGRFCVHFEEVCSGMERCIRGILFVNGLQDDSIQGILLSGYTAEPYRALLLNLLGGCIVKDNEDRRICSKALSQVQDLISKRNDMIHSRWTLYGLNDDNGNECLQAKYSKLHARKEGFSPKEGAPSKEDLDTLIRDCRQVSLILALLSRVIYGDRTLKECFNMNKDALIPDSSKLIKVVKDV